MHDLGHVLWVGPVLYRSCTASHIGRLGSICRCSADRDISVSDVYTISIDARFARFYEYRVLNV